MSELATINRLTLWFMLFLPNICCSSDGGFNGYERIARDHIEKVEAESCVARISSLLYVSEIECLASNLLGESDKKLVVQVTETSYGVYEAIFVAVNGERLRWIYLDRDNYLEIVKGGNIKDFLQVNEAPISEAKSFVNLLSKKYESSDLGRYEIDDSVIITNRTCEFIEIENDYGREIFLDLSSNARDSVYLNEPVDSEYLIDKLLCESYLFLKRQGLIRTKSNHHQ